MPKVLVRLTLKETCAIVAAAPGPFAVLLVELVGYHVGEVHEVAQVVVEAANLGRLPRSWTRCSAVARGGQTA